MVFDGVTSEVVRLCGWNIGMIWVDWEWDSLIGIILDVYHCKSINIIDSKSVEIQRCTRTIPAVFSTHC